MLLGSAGLAGVTLLASCSTGTQVQSQNGSTTAPPSGGQKSNSGSAATSLFAIFDRNEFVRAGTPQRLAFAVGGADGAPSKDAPEQLEFRITNGGQPVGEPIIVPRHVDGVPIAYFPLRFTPEQPGTYQAATTLGGKEATAAFRVGTAAEVQIPQVGEKMVAVDTPTTSNDRGVEPICTRRPQACSLHEMTLTEALASGQPVAFMISTPEFCQIGVCGPVLQLLIDQHAKSPGFAVVHAEVYRDKTAAETTPAVGAYHLNYEPALFVAKADGTIVDRLDNVFDRAEIEAAFAKANS